MIDIRGISGTRRLTLAITITLIVIISLSGYIDELAKNYIDKSTIQALAAFATARLLNSIISVASSLSVEISLVGGFSIQPLQFLDPLDDLVEQYSSAMKFAISSLVIQKILIEISSTFLFKLLLSAFGLISIASLFISKGRHSFILLRVFSFLALIRFLFIFVILMNAIIDQAFVDKQAVPRMQEVEIAAAEIERSSQPSGSVLGEDERTALLLMQENLERERTDLLSQLEILNATSPELEGEVDIARQKLQEMESGMSTLDRWNFFSREETYRQTREDVEKKEKQLEDHNKQRQGIENQLASTQQDIDNTVDILEGKRVDTNWLSGVRDQISTLRDTVRFERIKQILNGLVDSILTLMAIFIFKTLIIPLVFLLIFLRGFKYIWNIDPRTWVKEEYEKLKKS